jgi:hypothetical protein
MNNVLPRNRFIEFDVAEYLGLEREEIITETRVEERL